MSTLPETQSDPEIERHIVQALKKRRGKATLADIVVDTGLPQLEAERILRKAIGKFACHLEVTEEGEILYEFDPAMRRLDARERRQERWRAVGAAAWTAFSAFMKALIGIVMVLYVVLFVVLMVAAMVAASRGGDNNRRSSSSRSGHGGGGFWFWYLLFGRSNDPYRRHQRHNPRYDRWAEPSRRQAGKDERPFYMKVFSFVLGPDKGDVEPLGEDLALLALVRERNGAVTPTEVAAHTGWSLARAEQALTKMVARYEGNIAIDEADGRLVFTFASLLKTASEAGPPQKAPFFWDRWEQRLPLTGNTTGANVFVGGLNTFNLVASIAAPSLILPQLGMLGSEAAMIGLHYFPLAFSGLIFLLPVLRWLIHVRPENARRRARNLRRGVYRSVFESVRGGTIWLPSDELAERAQRAVDKGAYAPDASLVALGTTAERVAPELGGDFLPPEGEEIGEHLGWRFDPLKADMEAVARIRKQLSRDQSVVKVVFSTRAEEAAEEVAAEAPR